MQISDASHREMLRKERAHEESLKLVTRRKVEETFGVFAEQLIEENANGGLFSLFRKTIDSDDFRAKFKQLARYLGGEGELLEDWFEIRAEVFIQKVAKTGRLEIDDVRREFKIVAREYAEMIPRLERNLLMRRANDDPREAELQEIIEAQRLADEAAEKQKLADALQP